MRYTSEQAMKISSSNNSWYETTNYKGVYLLNYTEGVILANSTKESTHPNEFTDEIIESLEWREVFLNNISHSKIMEYSVMYPNVKFTNDYNYIKRGEITPIVDFDTHNLEFKSANSLWRIATRKDLESLNIYKYFRTAITERKTVVLNQELMSEDVFNQSEFYSFMQFNNELFRRLFSRITDGVIIYKRKKLNNQNECEYIAFRTVCEKYTASDTVSESIDEMVDKYKNEIIYVENLSLLDIGKLSENNTVVGFYK